MPRKARGKNKLGENKKQNHLKLAVYGFKEDNKGKSIKHKKSNNNKTKLSRYNKLP